MYGFRQKLQGMNKAREKTIWKDKQAFEPISNMIYAWKLSDRKFKIPMINMLLIPMEKVEKEII